MKITAAPSLLAAMLLLPAPALAQDYLGTHLQQQLDNQQLDNNLANHRAGQKSRSSKHKLTSASRTACSLNAMPAAEKRRLEAEYGRRLLINGKAKADLWAAGQGRAFRARLVAQGIC